MKFVKIVDKVDGIVRWFIVAAFMGSVGVIGVSILCRSVLHVAFPWSEEIAKYLTVFIVYCASAMAARDGGLTRLTFVEDALHLGKKGVRVIELLIGVIAIGFYLLVGYSTIILIQMVSKTNQLSPALKMPMWIPYVSMVIGCILLTVNTIAHLLAPDGEKETTEGSVAK